MLAAVSGKRALESGAANAVPPDKFGKMLAFLGEKFNGDNAKISRNAVIE